MSAGLLRWMRPWMCWKPRGVAPSFVATISRRAARRAQMSRNRRQSADDLRKLRALVVAVARVMAIRGPRSLPRAAPGWMSIRARMPSYLGSYARPRCATGGSARDASIGRTSAGSSRQEGTALATPCCAPQTPSSCRVHRTRARCTAEMAACPCRARSTASRGSSSRRCPGTSGRAASSRRPRGRVLR